MRSSRGGEVERKLARRGRLVGNRHTPYPPSIPKQQASDSLEGSQMENNKIKRQGLSEKNQK